MAIIHVEIDLSGLTFEEERSYYENEYGIGGYTDAYLTDSYLDKERRTEVLILDTEGDFSEKELRDLVLREFSESITDLKLDRFEEGLKPNDREFTFHDEMRQSS